MATQGACLLLTFLTCNVQIAPKEDELRAFQAYQGTYDDLSPPEQFLYVMASVPRLSDKINVLILMHQFEVMHFSLLSSALCMRPIQVLLHTPCSQGKQWRQHWHCALQGLRRDTQLSCLASEYACACGRHHGIICLFNTTLEVFSKYTSNCLQNRGDVCQEHSCLHSCLLHHTPKASCINFTYISSVCLCTQNKWKLVQAVCLTGGVCMQGFVGSAKASIDSVDAACDQVGNSRRLQDVLRAVLAVGNALNTGTARASADGVKLDSLMKLADVKVLSLCPFCGM